MVNLLQPSGTCIQRRALEWTIILKGGTARSKKKITGKNHNQAVDDRRQAQCQRNKDIRMKAIVDNFNTYVTALSYW